MQLGKTQKELKTKICENVLDKLACHELPRWILSWLKRTSQKKTEQEEQGSQVYTKLPGFYTCFLKSILEKRGLRANEQFVHGGL